MIIDDTSQFAMVRPIQCMWYLGLRNANTDDFVGHSFAQHTGTQASYALYSAS